MRYALYFTPPMSDALQRTASRWLGRNAFSGAALDHPDDTGLGIDDIAAITEAPRRYGFHATIKAPFALADGLTKADLLSEIMHFCGELEPFELTPLRIERLGPFFALTPSAPSPALQGFADAVVRRFNRYHAPVSEADRARRNVDRLSERQVAYLDSFGYPYVFEEFRFHMTLTGPVDAGDADRVEAALHQVFAPFLDKPVSLSNLALFVEPEKGAPFSVDSLHPLGSFKAARRAAAQ
ncbi:DUF1045 domain-containing protein [Georhizobium profundi]|uniref:DUF1045 domain-containing protein n=1 Tax=Georhizobium profundi TaxID=2341112 RepID=A0A3S9B2V7_9HYPH|nr:DUF1045 domain-containing protein [Georhizobium profundi]AZN71242.1 DUF1045 domain-containing protein [Georhizobium profundi]